MKSKKIWLTYRAALEISTLTKREFDRLALNKDDHFCIDDDDYVLFSKDFLDDPQGRKVFAEGCNDPYEDMENVPENTPEKRGKSRSIGDKWLSYQAAIDYTGLGKETFDRRYIKRCSTLHIKKGKLKVEKEHEGVFWQEMILVPSDKRLDAGCPDYGQWLNMEEAALFSGYDEEIRFHLSPFDIWKTETEDRISLFTYENKIEYLDRRYRDSSDGKIDQKGGRRI